MYRVDELPSPLMTSECVYIYLGPLAHNLHVPERPEQDYLTMTNPQYSELAALQPHRHSLDHDKCLLLLACV